MLTDASAPKSESARSAPPPRILIADDQPDVLEALRLLLKPEGYLIDTASSPQQMLRALELKDYDVVLMDLALPLMDGWEATRRLRIDPRTSQVLIVALTGHALAGHAEGARRAGCDAFVTKPCLPDDLVDVIRRLLDARSAPASPADAAQSGHAEAEAQPTP